MKSIFILIYWLTFPTSIFSQDLDTAKCNLYKKVFKFVEKMPAFPGGDAVMYKYIRDNLVYPESAKKDRIQGTVVVTFIIDTNGIIVCPKIARGISNDFDQETLRLMYNFPKWEPGMHDSKLRNVEFTLPIRFKLPEN